MRWKKLVDNCYVIHMLCVFVGTISLAWRSNYFLLSRLHVYYVITCSCCHFKLLENKYYINSICETKGFLMLCERTYSSSTIYFQKWQKQSFQLTCVSETVLNKFWNSSMLLNVIGATVLSASCCILCWCWNENE